MDEGQFIRGKTKEGGANLDPKTGDQWLTFGGAENEESSGVVDAFVGKPGHSNLLVSLMPFNLDKLLVTEIFSMFSTFENEITVSIFKNLFVSGVVFASTVA